MLRSSARDIDSTKLRGFTTTAILLSRAEADATNPIRIPATNSNSLRCINMVFFSKAFFNKKEWSRDMDCRGSDSFDLFPVLVAQLGLLAHQRNFLALNEDVLHVGLHVQRIAVGDNDVAHLAHFK